MVKTSNKGSKIQRRRLTESYTGPKKTPGKPGSGKGSKAPTPNNKTPSANKDGK